MGKCQGCINWRHKQSPRLYRLEAQSMPRLYELEAKEETGAANASKSMAKASKVRFMFYGFVVGLKYIFLQNFNEIFNLLPLILIEEKLFKTNHLEVWLNNIDETS